MKGGELLFPDGKLYITNDDQWRGMKSTLAALGWKEEEILEWTNANVRYRYGGALNPHTVIGNGNVSVSNASNSSITINGQTY
jgi:hypothetical protein